MNKQKVPEDQEDTTVHRQTVPPTLLSTSRQHLQAREKHKLQRLSRRPRPDRLPPSRARHVGEGQACCRRCCRLLPDTTPATGLAGPNGLYVDDRWRCKNPQPAQRLARAHGRGVGQRGKWTEVVGECSKLCDVDSPVSNLATPIGGRWSYSRVAAAKFCRYRVHVCDCKHRFTICCLKTNKQKKGGGQSEWISDTDSPVSILATVVSSHWVPPFHSCRGCKLLSLKRARLRLQRQICGCECAYCGNNFINLQPQKWEVVSRRQNQLCSDEAASRLCSCHTCSKFAAARAFCGVKTSSPLFSICRCKSVSHFRSGRRKGGVREVILFCLTGCCVALFAR